MKKKPAAKKVTKTKTVTPKTTSIQRSLKKASGPKKVSRPKKSVKKVESPQIVRITPPTLPLRPAAVPLAVKAAEVTATAVASPAPAPVVAPVVTAAPATPPAPTTVPTVAPTTAPAPASAVAPVAIPVMAPSTVVATDSEDAKALAEEIRLATEKRLAEEAKEKSEAEERKRIEDKRLEDEKIAAEQRSKDEKLLHKLVEETQKEHHRENEHIEQLTQESLHETVHPSAKKPGWKKRFTKVYTVASGVRWGRVCASIIGIVLVCVLAFVGINQWLERKTETEFNQWKRDPITLPKTNDTASEKRSFVKVEKKENAGGFWEWIKSFPLFGKPSLVKPETKTVKTVTPIAEVETKSTPAPVPTSAPGTSTNVSISKSSVPPERVDASNNTGIIVVGDNNHVHPACCSETKVLNPSAPEPPKPWYETTTPDRTEEILDSPLPSGTMSTKVKKILLPGNGGTVYTTPIGGWTVNPRLTCVQDVKYIQYAVDIGTTAMIPEWEEPAKTSKPFRSYWIRSNSADPIEVEFQLEAPKE